MKFLIDNGLSLFLAVGMRKAGYDAVHVREYEMATSEDLEIVERAKHEDRAIVTFDKDFGTILAECYELKPSVIRFKHGFTTDPVEQLSQLLMNLDVFEAAFEEGCILTMEKDRIRSRNLPIIKR